MKFLPGLSAVLSLALVAASPAPDALKTPPPDQQLLALVKEVQTQQITIAENQAKIDAKLAAIAEYLRLAQIYSSRGGK
ncbi:MAG TPA: hypothetical protein VGI42_05645 [Chthoniobacterales bacterium]|jgi:hypothetical protein